ncbi:glycosyltransferase family 4 protein [Chloroflexus sp.]|uniref:glycosyltransferase family 4 protein n=1 Tax=Chloroflexus sp. TaxID=1904827 RepID=UPI00298EFF04|nr:glycosyltransferase family 4 protein [Chloroflexus sp.]MDW8403383.1 glycosyltransferase family 4 protein [Chloroflexus sp.]
MRVVHLSTNDISGGAARAAYRLHRTLLAMGCQSTMVVANRRSADPTVQALKPPANPIVRWWQRWRGWQIRRAMQPYRKTRPAGLEPFSDDRSRYGSELVRALPPCDIVNLHWVAGFVDYPTFFRTVPRRVPVVWRLSDQQPFTGGCHYDEGCGRYAVACGACPQLGSRDERDLSHQIWTRKRAALAAVPAGRLHIVALNRWMAAEVQRSSLFGHLPVHIIPNGLDTTVFAPVDRAQARAVLDLPPDAKIVLFVAVSVDNRRKGFAQLAAALAGMSDEPNLLLLSIGKNPPPLAASIAHRSLGVVEDDTRLALMYSAADLFVIPSLQDNMPSTVLEALACGTPVVGFDAGGISELVRPGQTGWLAPVGDVAGLREAMRRLLRNDDERLAMGRQCRAVALAEYRQELQAQRYLDLYHQIGDTVHVSTMYRSL